jgi:signal transduction histidine kinase
MRLYLSSLRARLVLLTAVTPCLLLLGFLGGTLHTANDAVNASVRRSLSDAGSVFVKLLETRKNELSMMAAVTARDPRFFATFAIPETERGPEFAPTVEGVAFDFLRITDADFIEVFDAQGRALVHVERHGSRLAAAAVPPGGAVLRALDGIPSGDFNRVGDHLVVAGVAPVFVSGRIAAVLRLGSVFDRTFADEVKRLTGAEVCLTHAGGELASTYAPLAGGKAFVWPGVTDAARSLQGESFDASAAHTLRRGDVRYLVVRIGMRGVDDADAFDAFLGRELEAELRPMVALSARLGIAGALAIVLTGLAAWIVARRVVQPLSEIVDAASALQRGDYDHPLAPRGADEVAFLGRSFLDMRRSLRSHVEHLQSIDQMKGNFIALAGHELKTPLTVITSFNEMIVSGSLGAVPDNIRDAMRRIQERLWELNRLVEDILDMSRFEQGLFEFRMVVADPRELVAAVVERRRNDLEDRDVRILTELGDGEYRVHADVARLTQAVTQLVDNAIRFTPDGGTVTVTVGGAGDSARIAVRDTGVGIAPPELEWLFTKSHEVGDVMHHSSGRLRFGSRGLGLGLALCKAIIEGHGGSVHVHSVPGRGSEFALVLPLYRAAGAAAAATAARVPAEPALV